jgi:phage terminase large subunit-like protein
VRPGAAQAPQGRRGGGCVGDAPAVTGQSFSLPQGWRDLPAEEKQRLLVQQDQLLYASGAKTRPFRLTARNKQLAPEDPKHHLPEKGTGFKCGCAGGDDSYRVWLVLAGRGLPGFVKTLTGSNWVIEQALKYPGTKWGVASSTFSELDSVCFGGDSGILNQLLPGEMESFVQNKLRLRLFNGSLIQGYSADSPERIRGANLSGLWYDEAGSSRYPEFWYASARPAVRIGRARIVVTTTPRNTKLLRDLTSRTDGSVHITSGRMWENTFLDEGMAEDLRREYMGTRLGRQELEGEMLGDFEGALISRDDLDKYRIPREAIPLLSRVVVGVDPAMKAGEDHDESGIVVAGEAQGPDGEMHAYIVDDRSFRGTPNQVMEQVAAAVRKWEADCVVLETNQGGQWVRDTLRTVDAGIPVREVHAMKNKVLRAERVSALFEQGKIHMAGTFPELEDELCQLMPGEVPVRSPDRADAAVYAIFELRHLGQGGSWLTAYGMTY